MRTLILTFLLGLLIAAPHASAQAAALSQEDRNLVSEAQAYLQSFTTAKAKFTQINADKREMHGTFYLWRPGRLRFTYDKPYKDLVVADKLMIHFYDGTTGEVSDAPIGQTLAEFILRKEMKLESNEVTVSRVRQSNGLVYITVTQKTDPGMGALTLVFRKEGYELMGWTVIDAQGAITSIKLAGLQTGLTLPASLFVFKNPEGNGLNR